MAEDVLFYFDFISPYAYIAWTQVHAVVARAGAGAGAGAGTGTGARRVVPVPILFAALLDANGQKGPAEIPAKRVYTFKDAFRKAHRAGVGPLVPPPSHPFNPLLALRVCSLARFTVLDDSGDAGAGLDAQRRAIDALYAAAWRTGAGVETEEKVATALDGAGFDGAALVAEAGGKDVKERLRARTNEALARGVFGVPTAIVDGEIFWGVDGLELSELRLRGEDPIPSDIAWAERPASANRKAVT